MEYGIPKVDPNLSTSMIRFVGFGFGERISSIIKIRLHINSFNRLLCAPHLCRRSARDHCAANDIPHHAVTSFHFTRRHNNVDVGYESILARPAHHQKLLACECGLRLGVIIIARLSYIDLLFAIPPTKRQHNHEFRERCLRWCEST